MRDTTTAAFVGATGGAGTTRLTLEAAATLARADREVIVLDAAFATQGLSAYVSGRIDPDLTALLADEREAPLEAGLVDLELDVPGRVACCPVHAPFERIARAKTAGAARQFEERIAAAAKIADAVFVDAPPVAANQAVAAVNACARSALVTPATVRGRDATERMRARLADLDVTVDAVVSTRGDLEVADVSVPDLSVSDGRRLHCVAPEATHLAAMGRVLEATVGSDLDLPQQSDGLLDSIGSYVGR